MPAFVQLPTPATITTSGANVTSNLDTLLTAALSAASEAAPSGGSYAEVFLSIANTGTDDAYLAHLSDIPDPGTETAPVTTQVIPSGTALDAALTFGPYRPGSLPRLRLIDGAECVVTFIYGRA